MSHAEEEGLLENKFFCTLQSKFSDIFAKAPKEKEGYLICVPANASLTHAKFTEEFVRTHVLKVSPYFKQEYVTLNGQAVEIKGELYILCTVCDVMQISLCSICFII